MKKNTIGTLFSGGEGFGVGAKAAGLRLLWGIEKDADVTAVANRNLGDHVRTADVLQEDPHDYERPDLLHASPPCPNFSPAKQGASESEEDIDMASAVARFVETLRPRVFTLENVWLYRRSISWEIIRDTLYRCGYWLDVAHVNSADFGVPQTRKRMIVRAVLGGMVPYLPTPEPWQGWYGVIKDLLPTLPETQFAPWQLKRLPDALRETVLLSQGISRDHQGNEYGVTMRKTREPAFTVTANSNMNAVRAFLTTGQYSSPAGNEKRQPQTRMAHEPANTVTASNKGDWRAFVVDGGNAGRTPTVRMEDEPMFTVDATRLTKHPKTAFVAGRVVKMTARCLARWQTFPDWYELPESTILASRIIGNAVPCLLAEKLCEQLMRTGTHDL